MEWGKYIGLRSTFLLTFGNFLIPFKLPRYVHLTYNMHNLFYAIVAHYKARIEHVNRIIETQNIASSCKL